MIILHSELQDHLLSPQEHIQTQFITLAYPYALLDPDKVTKTRPYHPNSEIPPLAPHLTPYRVQDFSPIHPWLILLTVMWETLCTMGALLHLVCGIPSKQSEETTNS